jgi:serine phosphatase RsbU (regulator of sigma subunit)
VALYENIRERLRGNDHVTLSLVRAYADGRFDLAGAHEDLIVYRRRTKRCEYIETPGTWVGASRDIRAVTPDTSHKLEVGDILVLHTDGLTEAMNTSRELFGIERVGEVVERFHDETPEQIRDRLFDAVLSFAPLPIDDITVLVARYRGA